MMDSNWKKFEEEILGIAATFSELMKDPFSHKPPKEIVQDLQVLEKALTVALQRILPLQLEHQEGQDISKTPFNWPVVQTLNQSRSIMRIKQGLLANEIPAYPSDLINNIRELRDAATHSIDLDKPGKGGDERRVKSSAQKADLAKTFVFQFRSRFGHMPPMTKTGPEVELLRRMFENAGIASNDVAEQLRQAIEKDMTGREQLPSAKEAKSAKKASKARAVKRAK